MQGNCGAVLPDDVDALCTTWAYEVGFLRRLGSHQADVTGKRNNLYILLQAAVKIQSFEHENAAYFLL